jgi:uncharacterized protein involved in response to NO
MPTTAETLRSYRGPAIFSFGFRPFFLGGAIWAFLAMAISAGLLWGGMQLPSTMSLIDWHVHELLYGYLPCIVAGFLLTAVPNWTGRLPVAGMRLAALFFIWVAGRAAVAFSAVIGAYPAAIALLGAQNRQCFEQAAEIRVCQGQNGFTEYLDGRNSQRR